VAGLGVISASPDGPGSHDRCEHLHLHTEVAVVGAGPAGIAAALEATKMGARVVLIEQSAQPGGHLNYQRRLHPAIGERIGAEGDHRGVTSGQVVERLRSQLSAAPKVEVFADASCFGIYEGNLLGIVQRNRLTGGAGPHAPAERLIHLRAQRIVVATGAHEVPLVFENNDLPGVMLSSAVQRLLNVHGIRPADSAVIVSTESGGGPVAEDLRAAGVRIAAMVSPQDVIAALGRRHVTGLRTVDRRIPCDLIAVSGLQVPEVGLIAQGGGRLAWDEQSSAFLPVALPPTMFAAGRVTGTHDLEVTLSQGEAAGRKAARSLDPSVSGGDGEKVAALYRIAFLLSALGLVLSAVAHAASFLECTIPAAAYLLFFPGIFIVILPAMAVAGPRVSGRRLAEMWGALFEWSRASCGPSPVPSRAPGLPPRAGPAPGRPWPGRASHPPFRLSAPTHSLPPGTERPVRGRRRGRRQRPWCSGAHAPSCHSFAFDRPDQ
jgi:NADPH-dependent 2,4-dienoyl-CoA reductase/sulfur reductase-like enzyme